MGCASGSCGCCRCGGGVIGSIFFLLTLSVFVSYLLFIEFIRLDVLEGYFGVLPCSAAWIDVIIDSLFEYSLLCNLLIVISTNKWFYLPWLVIYAINGSILFCLAMLQLIRPVPIMWENGLERVWAGVPLALLALVVLAWIMIKRSYDRSFLEYEANLCKINPRFLVQIFGGFTAIACTVFIFGFMMNIIDKPIMKKLNQISDLSQIINTRIWLISLAICGVVTNLLLVMGGSGAPWRRALLVPWLLFHGIVIIACFGLHQWFTTLCWVEEKIYGLAFLVSGAGLLVLWTYVWLIASEASKDYAALPIYRNGIKG